MSDQIYSGACLCKNVRFQAKGPMRGVVACHCSQCRIQTGNYVTATRCETVDLKIEGEENLTWFEASNEAKRGFCKTCGTLMFWRGHGSPNTSIMLGCFDEPHDLKVVGHIYCADKGEAYEIADDLPKYDKSDKGALA